MRPNRPRLPYRLSTRLFLFNALLVFLPIAGLLYLDLYEREAVAQLERGMVAQARLLAAALGGRGELTAESTREETRALLLRLGGRTEARLRLYDRTGTLLADSARLGPKAARPVAASDRYDDTLTETSDAEAPGRGDPVYRLGAWLYRNARPLLDWLEGDRGRTPSPSGRGAAGEQSDGAAPLDSALREALAGRYGARIERTGGQRSLTLHSALPIESDDAVVGAAAVSQSTVRVLRSLYVVRLRIFEIFLASVGAAALVSLLLAGTISRPLARLSAQAAEVVDRRGRLRGRFSGERRRDEIGELARALESLTARLAGHVAFIESFSADVAHEFKNPLAAIRSGLELLDGEDDPAVRRRLIDLASAEVARLERLLGSVREITWIDARLESEPATPVLLADLLEALVASYRQRLPDLEFAFEASAEARPARVLANPDRLAQLFENLLDNAASFSPPEGRIDVELTLRDEAAEIAISDQGPGIPEPDRERVFERFFTARPEGRRGGQHSGLGLAIVRAIAEGYGGAVAVREGRADGAMVVVRLPSR